MSIKTYLDRIIPKYNGYQELHAHTDGSFRDAVSTVTEIFDVCEKLNRRAVAITDHGNMMRLFQAIKERCIREKKALKKELAAIGVDNDEINIILKSINPTDSIRNPNEKMKPFIEKYEDAFVAAVQKSIQVIPGIELYFNENKDIINNKATHIILYPKNWQGMKALFKIANLAQLNKNSKELPRTSWKDLEKFIGPESDAHGSVIATSACMTGIISHTLLQPWYITQKIQKLNCDMENMNLNYSVADIEVAKENLVKAREYFKKAKSDKTELNKALKSDYSGKVKKAFNDYEVAKIAIENQVCLFSLIDTGDSSEITPEKARYIKAETKYRELLEKEDARKKTVANAANINREVSVAEMKVKSAGAFLVSVEKEVRPLQKFSQKMQEYKEQLNSIENPYETAKATAIRMQNIFGKGNFFIELQDHGITEEKIILPELMSIIKETGIPATVANDCHYANPKDARKRALIAAMRYNMNADDIENGEGSSELYFKTDEQMNELFSDEIGQQGIKNTARIAEMCNVYYEKEFHLPEFDAKGSGYNSAIEYLEAFSRAMIPQKYAINKLDIARKEKLLAEIEERLMYELDIIQKMGYSDYIAIVQDFIFYARKIGGPMAIGPGRGSAAGSIVCYLTDITDIDPLRYDLIFERFLNPERVSMPDIDTDIAPDIRDKVISYVVEKYGYKSDYPVEELRDTVCNIVTESQLTARAAIRSVARVTNADFQITDKVAKMVPERPKMTIKIALEENEILANLYKTDVRVKNLIDEALLVEGVPAQTSVHAAGVIIADLPVSEYAPMLWSEKKNCWVIQSDMIACEADLGLLKMDFLGLKNLGIIKTAAFYVQKTKGIKVDYRAIGQADDPEVIRNIYASGQTNGVFQFEGGGITKATASFAPETIDDIILMNAAYRPGPMQFIPNVIDVKFKRKEAAYIVPEMKNILGNTYGSAIYQEQIQQIFNKIAGFSLGKSDIIRRAMSKKHLDELVAAKDEFVKGFLASGAVLSNIEIFWEQLLAFAEYAFNKSHAAAYSILSYYNAFLKHYFPCEYIAALMSYANLDKIAMYSADAIKKGIKMQVPNINTGVPAFAPTADGKEIRYGLKTIKGVANAATLIYDSRLRWGIVKDLRDYTIRACILGISIGASEGLIFSGALDCLSLNRKETFENLQTAQEDCRKQILKIKKENATENNEDLSDDKLYERMMASWESVFPNSGIIDFTTEEKLDKEREYLGIYVSGNPLEPHIDIIEKNRTISSDKITESFDRITIAGMVRDYTIIHRKSDNKPMAKFILDDMEGSINAIIFTKSFENIGNILQNGDVIKVFGRADVEVNSSNADDEEMSRQIIIRDVSTLKRSRKT